MKTAKKVKSSSESLLTLLRSWLFVRKVNRSGQAASLSPARVYGRQAVLPALIILLVLFGTRIVFKSRATVDCKAGVWSNLEACGWAGATNTGVPAGTILNPAAQIAEIPPVPANNWNATKPVMGPDGHYFYRINEPNMVIDGIDIDGCIYVGAHNVTIKNSRIRFSGTGPQTCNGVIDTGLIQLASGWTNLTLDHVTIESKSGKCVFQVGTNLTIKHSNLSGCGDAIFVGNDFTITDNYIHDFDDGNTGYHVDGIQSEGSTKGLIRHNTIALQYNETGTISMWNQGADTTNIVVDNNLLAGGSYTIYAQDYSGYAVRNISYTNNFFSTRFFPLVGQFGLWYPGWTTVVGLTATGNTILETGQPTYPDGYSIPLVTSTPLPSSTPTPVTSTPLATATPTPTLTVTPTPTPRPTATPTPVATPTPAPTCSKLGDVNCDGKVNNGDLNIVLHNYGKPVATRAQGDLTGDGVVNIFDLSRVLQNWGR